MKRILIGGISSGCGKTTVTCAVLQALCKKCMKVSSFKCGPDYIDPMFHEKIIGTNSHNLDSFFCEDNMLEYLLFENSKNTDISVIEGVMGFYDNYCGRGSAYSVSEITETPAVIVIDCKGMSNSIGAIIKGFLEYQKPNKITGFIFNRLPGRLVGLAKKICSELDTEYFGYMPANDFVIESRHLGLVTANEIYDLKGKINALGELAEKHILIDKLIEIADKNFPKYTKPKINLIDCKNPPIIAVSRDDAFCFEYSDNINCLKQLGCEIKYFSPLKDAHIPDNSCGLILCGGYPELYAEKLSENISMLDDIYKKIISGMPIIAECGGFMYLHKIIENTNRTEFNGVGIIDGKTFITDKLQRFGYIELTSKNDNMLCKKGEKILAHEFHYCESTDCGKNFTAEKADGRSWKCVHANENIYAGFPHLYFYSDIKIAENFVRKCVQYGGSNG